MVTEPLLEGTREFSVLSQWRQFFFLKGAQNCVFRL